jgi:branched-chain amino acid aminotransferase
MSASIDVVIYLKKMYERGMLIITSVQRRSQVGVLDPQINSLNYLNNIQAKAECARAGIPEALMLTKKGLVAEYKGDNSFVVKDGRIIGPGTPGPVTMKVACAFRKYARGHSAPINGGN